jgi:predicted O-methyltransferase YrrM
MHALAPGGPGGSPRVWRDLVYAWGNEEWSAEPEYLQAVAAAALSERGPVLECGSGLTTLVLGAVAKKTGSSVWTLEHEPRWAERARSAVARFRLPVRLCVTPLRNFGSFWWYDVDVSVMPSFGLVICDGPPSSTKGGRYGLLPVVGQRLGPGCRILLDDADREGEREVLHRWTTEGNLRCEVHGTDRRFAECRLP